MEDSAKTAWLCRDRLAVVGLPANLLFSNRLLREDEEMNKKAKMNEIKILAEMNKMNRPAATRPFATWSPLSHLHWRTLGEAARPAWANMIKITRQIQSQ